MSQFSDVVKVAKFFARYQKRSSIPEDDLRIAAQFFKFDPSSGFENCDEQKVPEKYLELGAFILDAYEVLPALPLDEQVKALRDSSKDAQVRAKFNGNSDSKDNVKVLRALLTQDWKTNLEAFKPQDLEGARRFAEVTLEMLSVLGLNASEHATPIETAPAPAPAIEPVQPPAQPPTPSHHNKKRLEVLEDELAKNLLDQPLAQKWLLEELRAREWGLLSSDGPTMFTLIGPGATGKSTMVNIVDRVLHDRPLLTLNMASMSSRNEGFALTGLRRGYDSAGPGVLTSFVRKNRNAIVVLENVTQAHPQVQALLIPLLSQGELTDEYGFGNKSERPEPEMQRVSFKDTIVFFTTREGRDIYDRSDYRQKYDEAPEALSVLLLDAIAKRGTNQWKQTESKDEHSDEPASPLIGYLNTTRVLPFRRLGLEALKRVASISLSDFVSRVEAQGIPVEMEEAVADRLALAMVLAQGPEVDALELKGAAIRALLPALVARFQATKVVKIEMADSPLLAEWSSANPQQDLLRRLFRRQERLGYDVNATFGDSGHLTLAVTNLHMQQVPVSADYGGVGGIAIDLPSKGFAAIKGHDHIKGRLVQLIALLKRPHGMEQLPKGMLLYGRPGTGKTMIARALAAEAKLPFVALSGPQLLKPSTISDAFALARRYAPSMVFIDEIDALGVRGKNGSSASINQLLSEIDGFTEASDGPVFIIAATNFLGNVDPALTRSGRLDLVMEVPPLDREARRHFLNKLKEQPLNIELSEDDLQKLVELSASMTGADLEKLHREAALERIRHPSTQLMPLPQVVELLNVIKHGARSNLPQLEQQIRATAYHEAGHAVVSLLLNPHILIEQVTIVPRGDALGFTAYNREATPHAELNRREVMDLICVSLAGRVAETKAIKGMDHGGPDAGAANDLAKATSLAWKAVTEWGLDETFGWASLSPWESDAPDQWRAVAAERVQAWIAEARGNTEALVDLNWASIERVAKGLRDKEMLGGVDLKMLLIDSSK